jgi:ribosomal-protein-serine acetyltransferase
VAIAVTRRRWDLGDGAVLRPYAMDDLDALWHAVEPERDRLGRWLHWANLLGSIDDERTWLEMATSSDAADEHSVIVVDGAIAGSVGLMTNPLEGDHEIGYWLVSAFEGRGLVTRACREIVSHAFAEHAAHRVTIAAAVSNARSRAVPERLGFVFDGVMREATRTHEGFSDLAVYGILDREWAVA